MKIMDDRLFDGKIVGTGLEFVSFEFLSARRYRKENKNRSHVRKKSDES